MPGIDPLPAHSSKKARLSSSHHVLSGPAPSSQDPESLLKRCEAEVRNLRQALLLRSGGGAGPENETLSPGQKAAVREEVRAFLVGAAAEPNLDITSVGLLREVLLQCRVRGGSPQRSLAM